MRVYNRCCVCGKFIKAGDRNKLCVRHWIEWVRDNEYILLGVE
jgi:hypothetical protein